MLQENSSCLGTFSILQRELTFPLIFILELAEVSLQPTLELTKEGNIAHFVVRVFLNLSEMKRELYIDSLTDCLLVIALRLEEY